MAEYIKRKDLLEIIDDIAKDETCPTNIAEDIYYAVDSTPAADVEPVKHGHWTETVIPGEVPDYDCVCSLCGKSGLPIYNFCPNCGAKMDEENGE